MSTRGFYRLAGAPVCIDWQDDKLREILGPALAHRMVEGEPADLELVARIRRQGWPEPGADGLRITPQAGGLEVVDAARRLAVRVDASGRRAEFECADAAELTVAEQGAPFRLIWQHWLATRPVQMLHAGAVGLPEVGAVLLVAHGGGGKSHTVLACLTGSALQLAGEDYLAVDAVESPRVWSLYSTAKLADSGAFPGLAADVVRPAAGGEKALLALARHHRARWGDGLPLRGILVLQITGRQDSRLVPATPAEAVKAMLASLLMVVPAARRGLFEFTTRLAGRLPVHRLELGTDLRQPPRLIEEFLQAAPR